MIIPIGINHVIRGWPWVTIALMAACILVHGYGDSFAPSPEEVQAQIAQRVSEVSPDADEAEQQRAIDDLEAIANQIPMIRFGYHTDGGPSHRLATSAFVHVGWWHLIGNMLFLWLAGAALEDRWGRLRFLGFYLGGAVVSAVGFAALHTGDEVILVGASGAIAALMGAFLVYFARMQIHFVYWFGIGAGRFDAVAFVALPVWFGVQLLQAWAEHTTGVSSVAFTAHVSGFAFGVAAAFASKAIARTSRDENTASAPPPEAKAVRVSTPRTPIAPPAAIKAPEPTAPADPEKGPRFLS